MYSVKIRNLLVFSIASLWSLSALANLFGLGTKVVLNPGAYYQSRLFGNMLVTSATNGTINYTVNEAILGWDVPPGSFEKKFAVKLSQRDDGRYDVYRLITPDGRKDGETLLEGSFSRNDDDRTAVLEYKDPEDGLWVRIEFSNTRTTPPETDADIREWRLKVITTVTDGAFDRARKELKIEDELQWRDIIAG